MVQEEIEAKTAKGSSSCTNGLLWLTRQATLLLIGPYCCPFLGVGEFLLLIELFTYHVALICGLNVNGYTNFCRAMDFLVELFRNLLEHQDWAMSQACTDSYTKTLKKWHGWLASSSFTVKVLCTSK